MGLAETRGEDADSAMFLATAYMHLSRRPLNALLHKHAAHAQHPLTHL